MSALRLRAAAGDEAAGRSEKSFEKTRDIPLVMNRKK